MKAGSIITMKIDNRYKDNHIVKKDGVLIGNDKTMQLERLETPANMLQPTLRVNSALYQAMKKAKIL